MRMIFNIRNKKKTPNPLLLVFIILIMLGSGISKAQPGAGDPGGGSDPDNPVPISGIEILLASGAALGLKRLYDSKKRIE